VRLVAKGSHDVRPVRDLRVLAQEILHQPSDWPGEGTDLLLVPRASKAG
jgi:hypothetical protein